MAIWPIPNGMVGERFGLAVQGFQHRGFAHRRARHMNIGRLCPLVLISQRHHHVEKAVAERLPAQRRHPRLGRMRKQFWRAVERVEIFADDRRVIEHRAVVEDERRYFRQRIVLHQFSVRLGHRRHGAHAIDASNEAALVRDDHHLAHERRARRPVQLHAMSLPSSPKPNFAAIAMASSRPLAT